MRVLLILMGGLLLSACGTDDVPESAGEPDARSVRTSDYGIDFNELEQNPTFTDGQPGDGSIVAGEKPDAFVNDERFHAALIAAVANYAEAYGNIDDIMRWAPGLCRRPPSATIRESASEDEGTHGKKLYWLYAKDRAAYLKAKDGGTQPVGQVLVKEAFVAEPGRGGHDADAGWQALIRVVERDGKPYHAGAKESLYVLLKLDPKTDGTDQGWVYGTLTPDGKTVTSAGKVATCMGCHTENTTDRMFGL